MHFSYFINLDIPRSENESQEDARLIEEMNALGTNLLESDIGCMSEFYKSRIRAMSSKFSRSIVSAVESYMVPYNEQTENPEYLEFCDETEIVQKEYENGTTDCFKTPDGRIVTQKDTSINYRFVIRDGKVCEVRHRTTILDDDYRYIPKVTRTKKAKKFAVIPNYPNKLLYSSLKDYVEKEYCYDPWDEKENKFGYYFNPNGIYDWYSIGGRWGNCFLVRDSCTEYCRGEVSDRLYFAPVPAGYRWVSGARKRDIEWEVMDRFRREEAIKKYNELKICFESNRTPDSDFCNLTGKGIVESGEFVYIDGETEEEYLNRIGCGKGTKPYPVPYGCISNGVCISECDMNDIVEYIDSVSDDDVLVCIDCHQ